VSEAQTIRELERELSIARKDSERLNWLADHLFTHRWNGVIGPGWSMSWQVAPDFRHTQQHLVDSSSGIMAGNIRPAIDAAMKAKP